MNLIGCAKSTILLLIGSTP